MQYRGSIENTVVYSLFSSLEQYRVYYDMGHPWMNR